MSYDVDTTADVLQMVPNKYAQAAGLGITVARGVPRRDPTNLALDLAQYGPYGRIAKKIGLKKFSNAIRKLKMKWVLKEFTPSTENLLLN